MQKYRRLLQYARRQRFHFVLIFALTVTTSALAALQPWPLKLLADHVLGKVPAPEVLDHALGWFALEPTKTVLLWVAVLGGLVLFLLNSALDVVLTQWWTFAGRRMVYDLAADLFARLQRRSLLFHSRNTVGDTLGRVTGDSWCVYQVFDTALFTPGHALLMLIFMALLMAGLDPTLTLLAFVVAPFMVGASFLVSKPLRLAAKLKRDIEIRIQSHIQQTLTGIPVVQAFVQEEREQERFQRFADGVIRAQQRSTLIGSLNSLSSGLIATLGTAVILWVGALHVAEHRLPVGGLLVFLYYLGSLQTQMKTLAGGPTALQGLSAAVDRVSEILEAAPEVAERPGAQALPRARGAVRMENVTFGYEPGHEILRGVSLEVEPGETLAIVGSSGVGKTTLVQLIPRFFDPWQGRVRVDGQDVRDVQLRSLRSQIALVAQEAFLFPFSISENIALGRPDAARAEIEAAARAANAHEFIQRLPQGYDTVLGERGVTLSGGERQRLSIARALLKDAPVLILDEPTSALDAETEQAILQALERLMEGRTTFIIAHRLSTVRRADRIVVLENGAIAESGSHAELLGRGGLYARLHHLQFDTGKPPLPAAQLGPSQL
ncbi:MAG: ABC transporter ATP-binding protein [Verrucomicrobiota bacterium]|nr:ABC transporter ATP-binding protein [Verrucomicrobiota bacterium]